MNVQPTPGSRLAAGAPAAASALVLALGLAVLPAGTAVAAPAATFESPEISISVLWERLSVWIGAMTDRERTVRATRTGGSLILRDVDPPVATELDGGGPSGYRRAEGEEGYRIDPLG